MVADSPLGVETASQSDQRLIPGGVFLQHFFTDLKICKCSAESDMHD